MPAADFTFDGENRLIKLSSGVLFVDTQDLYSRWKDWVMLSDNAKWIQAMRATGGDALVAPAVAPAYFFLTNGWRVQPQNIDHSLRVALNLYVDGGGNPFVATDDAHQVLITNVTSDSPGSGSGDSDCPTAVEIADEVMDRDVLTEDNFLALK